MPQRVSSSPIVVLTGATGFIGSHVAEALIAHGATVRCLVRPGRPASSWLDGIAAQKVPCDLMDPSAVAVACAGATHIIHLAGTTKAKRDIDYRRGNVDLTRSLLTAAERIPTLQRFCHISSLTAVGPSADGSALTEDAPCAPITAYGKAKLEAERLVLASADQLPVTIIRPPAVYGPRDRDTLEMFRWVGYGIKPVIGSSEKSLSLIHAEDLAQAIVHATLDERARGKVYFASDPAPHSFNELIELISSIVHRRPVPVRFPVPLLYAVAGIVEAISFLGPKPAVLSVDKARDMVQPHWVCSADRIALDLGFRVERTLANGLRDTYAWYRQAEWL